MNVPIMFTRMTYACSHKRRTLCMTCDKRRCERVIRGQISINQHLSYPTHIIQLMSSECFSIFRPGKSIPSKNCVSLAEIVQFFTLIEQIRLYFKL